MGYRPIRTLADACGHGFYVEVTCAHCERIAIFEAGGFVLTKWYFAPVEKLAAQMVCQGTPGGTTGCGRKGARIRFVTWPPVSPAPPPPPKPIATPAPRGIDQGEWDKADERERKRLVRIARG